MPRPSLNDTGAPQSPVSPNAHLQTLVGCMLTSQEREGSPLDLDRVLAAIEVRGTALARAMLDEAAALRVLDIAYERLMALGFRAALYCPKDGRARQFIEAGSLGIHVGHRDADGTVWLADGSDLLPSSPILFREVPAPATPATAGATP